MITAPYPIAPQLGPLAAPSEEEVAAAYPELRNQALTVAWAAEVLGKQAAQLLLLARAGELLLVPGPWPMRQADYPGYLVPAWQLLPGGRSTHPSLPTALAAPAEAGWTSLELHRLMTTPLADGEPAPADLLHAGEIGRVLALLRGEHDAQRRPPAVVHGRRRGLERRRRRRPARAGSRAGASR